MKKHLTLLIILYVGLFLSNCKDSSNYPFDVTDATFTITEQPLGFKVNTPITFTASASDLYRFQWDFGDNTTENETTKIRQHTYTKAGTYVINLKVIAQAARKNKPIASKGSQQVIEVSN